MFLEKAFKFIIQMQGREISFYDIESDQTGTLKAAPANYFRNLQGFEEMQIEGREWVVSKDDLDKLPFTAPVRNQRIIDPDMGTDIISEIKEMIMLGKIVGYRIRSK